MKKVIIFVVILILLIMGFFFLQREENNGLVESEELASGSDDYLDMQGYYLYPPQGYNCEGGFTDGYRYLDAECLPEGRDDYVIEIGAGLASSGINWDEGRLVGNQITVRSFEFTGGQYGVTVCEEFYSEDLNLDAEHYLCKYLKDGNSVITMGIGKSFYHSNSSFARWFEADLIIEGDDNKYTESDYVDILVEFLDSSIKIDWSNYAPEN